LGSLVEGLIPTALDNGQLAPKSWLARVVRRVLYALVAKLIRRLVLSLHPP
jgi:hypothetical protein